MNKHQIELNGNLKEYADKNAIITLDMGDFRFNVRKVGRLGNVSLAIEGYGSYPYTMLDELGSRHNLKAYVFETPPASDYCPVVGELLELWAGRWG